MSSLELSSQLAVSAPGVLGVGVEAVRQGATPYAASAEQAAAALVQISGASGITVEQYEASIPPNLAAAAALVDQLASGTNVSEAAMGSLYTLMDSSAALALTRE
ncbi:MAG: hypothetical protein ACRDLT_02780 [Solirubrobacteraceae bacterium]